MQKIDPDRIFYIKLGSKGRWSKECIEHEQSIRISFQEFTLAELESHDWQMVRDYFIHEKGSSPNWASTYANQLANFFETDEKTLWITFYKQKLWWAFAEPEVLPGPNEGRDYKYRKVVGAWKCKSVTGQDLLIDNLSGQLTKVQGYRSTLCKVQDRDYLVRKIKGEDSPLVEQVVKDVERLQKSLSELIKKLSPDDFEILIDLIFRGLGCRRTGVIGGPQKTKDIELEAPVINARYVVQVKSSANQNNFQAYQERFTPLTQYQKCYYAVHSPKKDLAELEWDNSSRIILWRMDEITQFTINAGLVDWVINKAG